MRCCTAASHPHDHSFNHELFLDYPCEIQESYPRTPQLPFYTCKSHTPEHPSYPLTHSVVLMHAYPRLTASSTYSPAGGKTPDPNKRTYADVMQERDLKREEVGGVCSIINSPLF